MYIIDIPCEFNILSVFIRNNYRNLFGSVRFSNKTVDNIVNKNISNNFSYIMMCCKKIKP